mmetsp:Transcript_34291/g.88625  ORF Transcript_34291/g.88625 Transcript_34291/m.88625 type:complete len:162 (+) Transcript_34291:2009-2494(+)
MLPSLPPFLTFASVEMHSVALALTDRMDEFASDNKGKLRSSTALTTALGGKCGREAEENTRKHVSVFRHSTICPNAIPACPPSAISAQSSSIEEEEKERERRRSSWTVSASMHVRGCDRSTTHAKRWEDMLMGGLGALTSKAEIMHGRSTEQSIVSEYAAS